MSETLTSHLETKEKFLKIGRLFLEKSIAEQYEKSTDDSPFSFAMFYEKFAAVTFNNNADCVFQYCESPIERVFLGSLILLFLKNGFPCLHFTPPITDVIAYMDYYRKEHLAIMNHIDSYKKATGDYELLYFENAVNKKKEQGKYTEEEVEEIFIHNSIIKHFEWNSYKLTLQAGFPNLKINGKSIRADIFIWVPGNEKVKIIVECDGFAFHNNKESFQTDRQRDRLFQINGYRVIRFSGSEINKDPAKISNELFDLLEAIDPDSNETRVL